MRTDVAPPRLVSVTTDVWKFDAAGIIDDQFAMAEILRNFDEPPVDWNKDPAPGLTRQELEEICTLLKLELPT